MKKQKEELRVMEKRRRNLLPKKPKNLSGFYQKTKWILI